MHNVVIEMVSPGFQCHQQLDMANCCAMLCYSQVFGLRGASNRTVAIMYLVVTNQ